MYHGLTVEFICFGAQDVITTSVVVASGGILNSGASNIGNNPASGNNAVNCVCWQDANGNWYHTSQNGGITCPGNGHVCPDHP